MQDMTHSQRKSHERNRRTARRRSHLVEVETDRGTSTFLLLRERAWRTAFPCTAQGVIGGPAAFTAGDPRSRRPYGLQRVLRCLAKHLREAGERDVRVYGPGGALRVGARVAAGSWVGGDPGAGRLRVSHRQRGLSFGADLGVTAEELRSRWGAGEYAVEFTSGPVRGHSTARRLDEAAVSPEARRAAMLWISCPLFPASASR